MGAALSFVMLLLLRWFKKQRNRICVMIAMVLGATWLADLISASPLLTCMALGTGLTVSARAAFAVSMRGLALRSAGDEGPWARRVLRGAEAFGALLVFGLGVLLAGAAIVGAPAGG